MHIHTHTEIKGEHGDALSRHLVEGKHDQRRRGWGDTAVPNEGKER